MAEEQRGEQPPPKFHVAVQEDPRQAGDQRGADRERQEPGDRLFIEEVSARPVGAGRARNACPDELVGRDLRVDRVEVDAL